MPQAEKVVRYIAPKASVSEDVKNKYKQKRVAAYCRVSTQQEELEIKVRLAEINEEFQKAMSMVSIDDENNVIIEQKLTELIMEKELLNKELAKYSSDHKTTSQSKINEIARLTDILENQPLQFNDELVRQMLQCIVVENKERIKVIFNDGTEIDQPIQ